MNQYQVDLTKLRRYPISSRKNKVHVDDFAEPQEIDLGVFPDFLTAKDLKAVVRHVVEAKKNDRAVILAMGGHVIKCGLGLIINDLLKKGIIDAILMNGAASIHDFEIAMIGETSEDVSEVLGEGEFGFAEETGTMYNEAIQLAYNSGKGFGEGLGKYIQEKSFQYSDYSIIAKCASLSVPCLVSVAIGDDITHMHPEASGAAIGDCSHRDFLTLCSLLPNISAGGVYFNIGSAVILPEVFLKAFSVVQNLGYNMDGLYTVNMDMQTHYRSLTNVVRRPTNKRGEGFNLIGTHEIMLPLLAGGIIKAMGEDGDIE